MSYERPDDFLGGSERKPVFRRKKSKSDNDETPSSAADIAEMMKNIKLRASSTSTRTSNSSQQHEEEDREMPLEELKRDSDHTEQTMEESEMSFSLLGQNSFASSALHDSYATSNNNNHNNSSLAFHSSTTSAGLHDSTVSHSSALEDSFVSTKSEPLLVPPSTTASNMTAATTSSSAPNSPLRKKKLDKHSKLSHLLAYAEDEVSRSSKGSLSNRSASDDGSGKVRIRRTEDGVRRQRSSSSKKKKKKKSKPRTLKVSKNEFAKLSGFLALQASQRDDQNTQATDQMVVTEGDDTATGEQPSTSRPYHPSSTTGASSSTPNILEGSDEDAEDEGDDEYKKKTKETPPVVTSSTTFSLTEGVRGSFQLKEPVQNPVLKKFMEESQANVPTPSPEATSQSTRESKHLKMQPQRTKSSTSRKFHKSAKQMTCDDDDSFAVNSTADFDAMSLASSKAPSRMTAFGTVRRPPEMPSADGKPVWATRKLRSTSQGELLKKGDLAKPITASRRPVIQGSK